MKAKLTLEIEKGVDDNSSKVGVSAHIDIKNGEGSNLSGSVLLIPKCNSYEILEQEVARIKEELDALLDKSKKIFGAEGGQQEGLDVNENMSAKEIWDILSMIKAPERLAVKFNGLSHQKRLEVADYVFTHANIFSGAAAVFSSRYNSEKSMLE